MTDFILAREAWSNSPPQKKCIWVSVSCAMLFCLIHSVRTPMDLTGGIPIIWWSTAESRLLRRRLQISLHPEPQLFRIRLEHNCDGMFHSYGYQHVEPEICWCGRLAIRPKQDPTVRTWVRWTTELCTVCSTYIGLGSSVGWAPAGLYLCVRKRSVRPSSRPADSKKFPSVRN